MNGACGTDSRSGDGEEEKPQLEAIFPSSFPPDAAAAVLCVHGGGGEANEVGNGLMSVCR